MTTVSVSASSSTHALPLPASQPLYVGHQGHTHALPSASASTAPKAEAPNSKVKFESALDFLEKVKNVFEDRPSVYAKFLDIMKEFKAHTLDTPGVIARVKFLFQGHPDLILGFNSAPPLSSPSPLPLPYA